MRKISLVLLSIGALLALSIYWQGPASADRMGPAPPEGFGKKIAGTYLMWGEWVPTEPVFPILLTINADGTMLSTSSAALGRGEPEIYSLRQNFIYLHTISRVVIDILIDPPTLYAISK